MRFIWMRLYRERRRVAVISGPHFLGFCLFLLSTPMVEEGLGKVLTVSLALTGGFVLTLVMLALAAPGLRRCAELFAICILLGGAVHAAMTALGLTNNGAFGAGLVILCGVASLSYTTGALDRFIAMRPRVLDSTANSILPAKTLWCYIAVTPESDARFRSRDIIRIEWIEPKHSYRLTKHLVSIAKYDQALTILQHDAPSRFYYRFAVMDMPKIEQGCTGTADYQLEPTAKGTRLVIRRSLDLMTIRAWLFVWIDDHCGRMDDALVRDAERMARQTALQD